jgi:hypothetical protein
MGGAAHLLTLVVAATFVAAAAVKALQPRLFARQLAELRVVPPALVPVAAGLVVVLEAAGGVMCFIDPLYRVGAGVLAVLLCVFAAVTASALSGGARSVSCACFGRSSHELSWAVPVRDLLMAAPVAIAAAIGPERIAAVDVVVAVLALCLATEAVAAVGLFSTMGRLRDV